MRYSFNSTVSGDANPERQRVQEGRWALGLIKGAETYTPKPNLGVELWSGDGKTKVATAVTDVDGYYMCIYKYTGKATDFIVKVPASSSRRPMTLKANGFVIADFDLAGQ